MLKIMKKEINLEKSKVLYDEAFTKENFGKTGNSVPENGGLKMGGYMGKIRIANPG